MATLYERYGKAIYEQYTQARPAGPLMVIPQDGETTLRSLGPHSIGEKVYIVGTNSFGTIIMGTHEHFLRIYWEDGIISADFLPQATLHHIITVPDDSPQERLKLVLKYGS